MELIKEIFREYDIRGIYQEEMDDETAYLIGKAFGTKLREFNKTETVVAYDNRLSSTALEENLVKGLVETGINVKRIKIEWKCIYILYKKQSPDLTYLFIEKLKSLMLKSTQREVVFLCFTKKILPKNSE